MRSKLLVLLLALAALGACDFDSGPRDINSLPGGAGTNAADRRTPGPRGGSVLVVGDSLLVGAIEHGILNFMLETDGWVPEAIAERGRSVPWATDQIELRVRVPRYVVVVLGSNPGFSSAGFADNVLALRQALEQRGARRILWIPPHHPDPQRYAEKLAVLREADRLDRMLVVPDWGSVLDANPHWVSGDGIHLYDQGYAAMSTFIREQLARLG
jgi:lysophospholipase L1-like esterase